MNKLLNGTKYVCAIIKNREFRILFSICLQRGKKKK